jgi:transposase
MYREVTMVEVTEVLRLWRAGLPRKRLTAQLGLDIKTVRRYLAAAGAAGVGRDGRPVADDEVRDTLLALQPIGGRPRGEGWAQCETQRPVIARWLADGLRLTKIQKLLTRQGVVIAYATLYRFAVSELQFGQTATTIPVVDGAPGQELQLDTGWVVWLTLAAGRRRRFRAWIFTAVRSRHRFVYPAFEETTTRAIEACEAAWAFFGGVFAVVIPDNTKAIIVGADPLTPRITPAFLEYAQARHFHIDPARVRAPRDKGRVERAVPGVRDDCFAGEVLLTLDDAHGRARTWCLDEYGLRRHSRTQRRPLSTFAPRSCRRSSPCPPRRTTSRRGAPRRSRAPPGHGRELSANRRHARHHSRGDRQPEGSHLDVSRSVGPAGGLRRHADARARRAGRASRRLCR